MPILPADEKLAITAAAAAATGNTKKNTWGFRRAEEGLPS
jgi:hypothetical protein